MDKLDTQIRETAKKVSTYFSAFLDSDFKRQSAPRRRIMSMTDTGFRSSMRTSPYPNLDRDLWALLSRPSGESLVLNITPRKYVRPISDVLLKVIREQIEAVPEQSLERVRFAVRDHVVTSQPAAKENPEEWIEGVRAALTESMADQVVRPLIAHLAGPMASQAYWVIDTLHGAESELVARVASDLATALPDALAKLLATGDEALLTDALTHCLTIEGARTALTSYFITFAAADAYLEFRDLETYVATGEGMQMYLYIGSLRFGSNNYPLFFLPIDVRRRQGGDGYELTIVNHLYAHRRAIDFVLEEMAREHRRAWVAPLTDRMTYLKPEQTIFEEARYQFKLVANALDLGGQIDLGSASADVSNTAVKLSSALYIAADDVSQDSLINDYEEIIDLVNRGGAEVVNLFNELIGDVLLKNPVSIAAAVERDWDALPMVDRVVFDSPIPLNEEQRKVLLALHKPEGKIIVVKGPPGTGKSHTITAIGADCAFNQKSCLILSDKREALEVVYDKLSEAMSRVRHNNHFPNPLLRIGRQDANFRALTSTQSIQQVSAYAKSMRANRGQIDAERRGISDSLKDGISKTVQQLGSVQIAEIQRLHADEAALDATCPRVIGLLTGCDDDSLVPELEALVSSMDTIESYLRFVFQSGEYFPEALALRMRRDGAVAEFAASHSTERWRMFESLDVPQAREIGAITLAYRQLKMPVLGYLLRSGQVRELERRINELPTNGPIALKESIPTLMNIAAGVHALKQKLDAAEVTQPVSVAYRDIAAEKLPPAGSSAALKLISVFNRLSPGIVPALLEKPRAEPKAWGLAVSLLVRWLKLRRAFMSTPQIDFVGAKTNLERLNTTILNSYVDDRLISFMENNRSDAKAIAGVISHRQKFPEDKFDLVRSSFPVIIAGIREFAEFMPLAPDLFDVLVIDEASQVSVAQALPALLRAKKVVVLGDERQYSNVKAANASIEQNEKYRAELTHYVRTNVSDKSDVLQRLAMFDVKKSILDFAQLTASYEVMLRKHFRSYQELIGYSSREFYGGALQAIKIRAKPVSEVIRFSQVDTMGWGATRTVNEAEAEFILERLLEFIALEEPPSVGVITPFREQQTFLSKRLFGHKSGRAFEEKLRLKVMTFDSCQGEERQTVFYSMVATAGNDALNYVFPISIADADHAVEDKLKVQRLNVGFSRAQETVWFVHSRPISEYRGAIGQALNYYVNTLENAANAPETGTDPSSPMEVKVLEWLKQTQFYQLNADKVQIIPQFKIGRYLRQLDPNYKHPAWRVDFLVTYTTEQGSVPVVIEYDGFEWHFQKGADVNVGNHERYLSEADVERQLTLELYGYHFLRLSRFSVTKNPVETLSHRLYAVVNRSLGEPAVTAVDKVKDVAEGLTSNSMKTCPKCKQIKAKQAFFDPTLRDGDGGYGRNCMECKLS